MKLNISKEQTGHLMTDLGISTDRCTELCGLIGDILQNAAKSRESITLAQVLQAAAPHARDTNELVFLSTVGQQYMDKYIRFNSGMEGNPLADLFATLSTQFSSRS